MWNSTNNLNPIYPHLHCLQHFWYITSYFASDAVIQLGFTVKITVHVQFSHYDIQSMVRIIFQDKDEYFKIGKMTFKVK